MDGGAVLESTPQPSLRPQFCPGVCSETSILPDCLGSVTSQPTEQWDPATPCMKQHCVACIIRLLVLFLALGFHSEMTVSLELPRGTRVTPALRRVQEVGGLHGKWSSCLPIIYVQCLRSGLSLWIPLILLKTRLLSLHWVGLASFYVK